MAIVNDKDRERATRAALVLALESLTEARDDFRHIERNGYINFSEVEKELSERINEILTIMSYGVVTPRYDVHRGRSAREIMARMFAEGRRVEEKKKDNWGSHVAKAYRR